MGVITYNGKVVQLGGKSVQKRGRIFVLHKELVYTKDIIVDINLRAGNKDYNKFDFEDIKLDSKLTPALYFGQQSEIVCMHSYTKGWTWAPNFANRMVEFLEEPTGDLATWLQENADEIGVVSKGYTVTYTNSANSSAPCKYSLDGGNTWTTITESSGTIENVETIKFLLNYDAGMYGCEVVSTILGLNKDSTKGYTYTDTYTLTEDVTDLTITMTPAI